jgi:hypothetical protein
MISRAELDELYRADDEARAEHAEWLTRREAQARPFVRKSDDPPGLIFKTVENEPAPGAAADAAPSDDELSSADLLSEALIDVGGRVIADLRREWRRELEVVQAKSREIIATLERDRERDPLKAEIAELRVRLDMLVAMMLGKSDNLSDVKSADVVADLPNWRKRDAA